MFGLGYAQERQIFWQYKKKKIHGLHFNNVLLQTAYFLNLAAWLRLFLFSIVIYANCFTKPSDCMPLPSRGHAAPDCLLMLILTLSEFFTHELTRISFLSFYLLVSSGTTFVSVLFPFMTSYVLSIRTRLTPDLVVSLLFSFLEQSLVGLFVFVSPLNCFLCRKL